MSTILSADDLNDFIAPGVACIKPVEVTKTQDKAEIEIGVDGVPVEVDDKGNHELQAAQISLTDCLACSGCITSSEALLVELQSPKELLSVREKSPDLVFVVSICPQSRASLAHSLNTSVAEIDSKLASLFVDKLGFSHIVGTEIGRAISLETSALEVASRTQGPILSSVCPGWTCYAEKSHPHIIPYLSSVRSPQQITGRLVKTLISRQRGIPPENVYHLSVMPCFDKKLEASRAEFALGAAREVDLVLTARELVDMCQTHLNTQFAQLPQCQSHYPNIENWPALNDFKSNLGSSSGGYLAYVLSRALHFHPGAYLETLQGKNADMVEYNVIVNGANGPQTVFKGAQIYGFRNIQNLVRKLKPGKARVRSAKVTDPSQYNYVEVMACPGGCLNGGGQMAMVEQVSSKVWLQQLEAVYSTIELCEVSSEICRAYMDAMGVKLDSDLVEATYKPVESTLPPVLAVGTQW